MHIFILHTCAWICWKWIPFWFIFEFHLEIGCHSFTFNLQLLYQPIFFACCCQQIPLHPSLARFCCDNFDLMWLGLVFSVNDIILNMDAKNTHIHTACSINIYSMWSICMTKSYFLFASIDGKQNTSHTHRFGRQCHNLKLVLQMKCSIIVSIAEYHTIQPMMDCTVRRVVIKIQKHVQQWTWINVWKGSQRECGTEKKILQKQLESDWTSFRME